MTTFTALIAACVRCWTRMYTWRLPPAVRDARREEIESDLWESSHDQGITRAELVIQLMMRLTLGLADDVAWRFAQVTAPTRIACRAVTAVGILCMVLLVARLSRMTTAVPHLPEAPIASRQVHRPVPDPPPPPPDARPGSKPSFQYGRSSYSVMTEGPPPVLITQVPAIYPPVAMAGGLEGSVLVRGTISDDGRVIDTEVAPAGILGRSALHAVQQWKFDAAGNRTTRPARLTVTVSFGRSR